MNLTLAKLEELAPDQGSLDAARKLLKAKWPAAAGDGAGLVWGECQGSGSQPYRVVLAEQDLGYKCTCPSRKFPCKHVLALMWMRVEGRAFATEDRPVWVAEWLGRRRGPGSARPAAEAPRAKLDAALAVDAAEPEPADPKAEARAAVQRERNQAEREASILAGLDDLDRWLEDQMERGLAAFPSIAAEQSRTLARRLVDAKATGLAARVEQLPPALFAVPEAERVDFLIETLGMLHLMAAAYRRRESLPAALRADIRAAVGAAPTRDAVLEAAEAVRIRDRWLVLATVNEVQPDKLRRIETWLGRSSQGEGPRFAVLIDFMPVSLGTVKNTYSVGEAFEAELVYYPSGAPLRGIIAQQFGSAARADRWTAPAGDVAAALDRYDAALAARPWLGDWPLAISGGAVHRRGDGFALSMRDGGSALPIGVGDPDTVLPLLGLDGIDAFGLWNGRDFALKFAETPLGRWVG
jgi:hypothetical protein